MKRSRLFNTERVCGDIGAGPQPDPARGNVAGPVPRFPIQAGRPARYGRLRHSARRAGVARPARLEHRRGPFRCRAVRERGMT